MSHCSTEPLIFLKQGEIACSACFLQFQTPWKKWGNRWELHTRQPCFVRVLEILMLSHASKLRHAGRGAENLDWPLGMPSCFTRFETFYLHLLSVKPCRRSSAHFCRENWCYVEASAAWWDSRNDSHVFQRSHAARLPEGCPPHL